MTEARLLIESIEAAGGVLTVHGKRIRCQMPADSAHFLTRLRAHKNEVLHALRHRDECPVLPAGIRLIEWKLKAPPVVIETFAVVTDPALFAGTTLEQLRLALQTPGRWLGWSVPQLIDRLAQVGVLVTHASD